MSQNGVKLYVIYNVYIIYTTILNLDYWMKIKDLTNCSGCKSFDILTIQNWNGTILNVCLKFYAPQKNTYYNYFNIVMIFSQNG
jgi:hypothetical protein